MKEAIIGPRLSIPHALLFLHAAGLVLLSVVDARQLGAAT